MNGEEGCDLSNLRYLETLGLNRRKFVFLENGIGSIKLPLFQRIWL
jgi:hypothetical protein